MDKKKELSEKDLKKASGGAWASGEHGGHTHPGDPSGPRPRAGYAGNKPVHDAGNVNIKDTKPKGGHIRPV